LVLNIVFGFAAGYLLSLANPILIPIAQNKISTWSFSIGYFLKSFFCGIIMYISIEMFKRNNIFGILYGIPIFILSGF
jgi:hypothetical protein